MSAAQRNPSLFNFKEDSKQSPRLELMGLAALYPSNLLLNPRRNSRL
jgi:hypothetical protein